MSEIKGIIYIIYKRTWTPLGFKEISRSMQLDDDLFYYMGVNFSTRKLTLLNECSASEYLGQQRNAQTSRQVEAVLVLHLNKYFILL